MSAIEVNGTMVDLDEDGFIMDPCIWTEDVAMAFAPGEGVGKLTDEHWKVIRCLRDYYQQFNRCTNCFRPAPPRAPASWPACPNRRDAFSRGGIPKGLRSKMNGWGSPLAREAYFPN